jgi:RNase P protein component
VKTGFKKCTQAQSKKNVSCQIVFFINKGADEYAFARFSKETRTHTPRTQANKFVHRLQFPSA